MIRNFMRIENPIFDKSFLEQDSFRDAHVALVKFFKREQVEVAVL